MQYAGPNWKTGYTGCSPATAHLMPEGVCSRFGQSVVLRGQQAPWLNALPYVDKRSFPEVGSFANERTWVHADPAYVNGGALGLSGLPYFFGQAFGKKRKKSKTKSKKKPKKKSKKKSKKRKKKRKN